MHELEKVFNLVYIYGCNWSKAQCVQLYAFLKTRKKQIDILLLDLVFYDKKWYKNVWNTFLDKSLGVGVKGF